jgi:hypothetical protein
MERADIEMLWPPVAVPVSVGAGEGAFARAVVSLCVHGSLRSRFCNFLSRWSCAARACRADGDGVQGIAMARRPRKLSISKVIVSGLEASFALGRFAETRSLEDI